MGSGISPMAIKRDNEKRNGNSNQIKHGGHNKNDHTVERETSQKVRIKMWWNIFEYGYPDKVEFFEMIEENKKKHEELKSVIDKIEESKDKKSNKKE